METEEIKRLQQENEKLKEENERLREQEERRKNLPPKERLYDRIPLTVKQMDVLIGILLAVLVITLILGIINR